MNYSPYLGDSLNCSAGEYVVGIESQWDPNENAGSICYKCSGGANQYLCHGNTGETGARNTIPNIKHAVPGTTSCPDGTYVQGIDLDHSPSGGIKSRLNVLCSGGYEFGVRDIDPKKICDTGIMGGVTVDKNAPNYAASITPSCVVPRAGIPIYHKPAAAGSSSSSGLTVFEIFLIVIAAAIGCGVFGLIGYQIYQKRQAVEGPGAAQSVNPAAEGQV